MKRPSDFLLIFGLLMTAAFCGSAYAGSNDVAAAGSASPSLFAVVPAGDPTYAQLQKLSGWGYLPKSEVDSSLTRYEVADLILRARRNYDESKLIHVAQADLDLSQPETTVVHHDKSQSAGTDAAGTTSADAGSDLGLSDASAESAPKEEDVEKTFTSLQQAYEWELSQVKDQVKSLQDRVAKMDEQNYKLWKDIRSLTNQPSISVHGFGRSWSWSDKTYGPLVPYPTSNIADKTFLEINPYGVISKELSWNAVMQVNTDLTSNSSATSLTLSRLSIKLNPSFMSVTFGDFDLSWTPFTVWSRDCDNDFMYTPGYFERQDQYVRYPNYINNPPDMPFRGVKVGTSVMWPDSDILDSFKVGAFAHMLRSGYASGYAPFRYSGWILGAMSEIKTKKYFTLGAYGLLFDEPLDTDDPSAVYLSSNASTWARQYRVGSLTPKLEFEANNDYSVGAEGEGALSNYWDDKYDTGRKVEDWSIWGGPFVKYKQSSLSIKYLNVGYGFYSPLAQDRQRDDLSDTLMTEPIVLSNNIGTDALGRPSALFKFYNRTTDNVFPYGLATPNRKGFGGNLDWKALDKDALTLKAMIYAVQELSDNFVVNKAGTSFQTVDSYNGLIPERKFLYINFGPHLDLSSLLSIKRRLDLGLNVRSESTKSDIGTLNSTMFQLGFGVGITGWMDAELAVRTGSFKGREMTYEGLYARTCYPYDNSDLGLYSPTDLNGTDKTGVLSLIFKIDRHSKLVLDAMSEKSSSAVATTPTQTTQSLDMVYEITF
jgi:hypothetical protein